jgi:hypothetical protein
MKSKTNIKLNPIPQIPINLQDREREKAPNMEDSIAPIRTNRKEAT